jgi:HEPN domain-containing protein
MAQPTLLSIAKADLVTAKKNVNDKNKFIKHQAAYFTQQSIEKTIKYLIELKLGSCPRGHDISKLVYIALQNGITIPTEIQRNASMYTAWEAVTRYYPTKVIRRDTISKAIYITDQWHKALHKQGIK